MDQKDHEPDTAEKHSWRAIGQFHFSMFHKRPKTLRDVS